MQNYEVICNFIANKRTFFGERGHCRYCGKSPHDVSFSKVAHALPELVGNKFLFSLDECNECNEYFDKNLENDLTYFLGISRTISKFDGKKGIPKYKSKDGERIEVIDNDLILIEHQYSNMVEVASSNLSISVEKSTYTPAQAYKCFVKMALAIIPQSEQKSYKQTVEWIRQNKKPSRFDQRALQLHHFFFSGNKPFPAPWITLFKRTGDKKKYAHLTCTIAFYNSIYLFAVPFGAKDKFLDFDKFELPFLPTFSRLLPGSNGEPTFEKLDLSESGKVRGRDRACMQTRDKWEELMPSELPDAIKKRLEELGLKLGGAENGGVSEL